MTSAARYLIIGGGVAGTSAAEAIRHNDASGRIVIVSDEPYRFYSRIMLSKPAFFLGKIPFDSIWLKEEGWYREQNIELIAGHSAVTLDTKAKTASLNDGRVIGYDKLLLAAGGCARTWEIPGAKKSGIFYLRTLDDGRSIIAAVRTAKRAICVGSGFVSFEMCEMLRLAGIEVTLIMREKHYWEPTLDETSGRMIETALENNGVTIIRQAEVAEVQGEEAVSGVILKDGRKLPCDMIMVGIGIVCPFGWLSTAGITINRGIVTNEYLETNISDIWAAGDAAEFTDLILDERIQLGNWVNAQMQGRLAGANMTTTRQPFRLVSFYTAQGFGTTIAFTGDIRALPDRRVITRQAADKSWYERFIVKDGEIIGATLINRTTDLQPTMKLIEYDVKVGAVEEALRDPRTSLADLVNKYAGK